MDWFQWYVTPPTHVPFTSATAYDGTPPPTDLDLELVEVIYAVIAGETTCSTCGRPLGRALRARYATAWSSQSWSITVATRCEGWRRHAHVALVTRPSRDLLLGDLELRSR